MSDGDTPGDGETIGDTPGIAGGMATTGVGTILTGDGIIPITGDGAILIGVPDTGDPDIGTDPIGDITTPTTIQTV